MRTVLSCLILSVGLGCSSDEPTQADRLIGGWKLSLANGCVATMLFDGDDGYEAHEACELEDGSHGSQFVEGEYEVAGDELTLRPRRASCPEKEPGPESARIEVDDERLRVILRAGVLTFERVDEDEASSPAGGGALVFGCWDDATDSLIEGEIVDL